jgi:hypothetical protein
MKTINLTAILILDNAAFDDYLRDLSSEMESLGHPIAVFILRDGSAPMPRLFRMLVEDGRQMHKER